MPSYKVLFYSLLAVLLAAGTACYAVWSGRWADIAGVAAPPPISTPKICNYNVERLKGYKHIRPLVWVHQDCEAERYLGMKEDLTLMIKSYISTGVLQSASFCVQDLKQGDGIAYNEGEKFSPGSLMKVTVMITILKMAEDHPGLLDKEVLFQHPSPLNNATPFFPDEIIQVGHKYTIRQLLERMIQKSDNEAAMLLCNNLDMKTFEKTFTDFGFPQCKMTGVYPLTSAEFSAYMEMLYNAGYLTIQDSEYATDLLTSVDFKKGITAGLPDSIQVAHKFGEYGIDGFKELHESAIVYYDDTPYLITIMTRGYDFDRLSEVISAMSKQVYHTMVNQKNIAQVR